MNISKATKKSDKGIFRRRLFILIVILILISPPIYIISDTIVKINYKGNINEDQLKGAPNYNNTLYMTPILERYTGNITEDNNEIELIKSRLGPSGDYYKVGFSVSCWYSLQLTNSSGVWNFDPTWLYYKLNRSVDTNAPILFHMNGGNWGSCGMSNALLQELWQNDSNCQWDQFNHVPEIKPFTGCLRDRLFSLQKDTLFNQYRKLHIQQAGKIIAEFAKNYPDLFVGCSLDSEIHLDSAKLDNGTKLYYDYNPLVIKEYREWLQNKYTLSEFNEKFNHAYNNFSEIDAPRVFNEDDPEWQEWTLFRHHLVGENVMLQAKWLYECGIPKNKIFSHQILSNPGSESAEYERCDTLETAISDYCVVGVTRYNYIDPSVFWEINSLSGTDWGIFEWNIWHEHGPSDYQLYTMQLKAMYQAGVHVICPNGWFEYVNPPLMIRNNSYMQSAISDFAKLIKDKPRTTSKEGRLGFNDYLFADLYNSSQFLNDKLEILLIPFVISLGAGIIA
ncbi:MAG: beta-galactosidase, partial [Promethearchaeota archaeon]